MGRASSSKKVARAARAAGRPGAKRNIGWPLVMGLIVVGGFGLIVLSVAGDDDGPSSPPTIGDHWHAAYGVYLCDEFLPPLTDVTDEHHLHSHADGLIHIHPTSSRFTGENANLGAFADTVGMELDDDSLSVPGRPGVENGDDCDGEEGGDDGIVQVMVWESAADEEGRLLESDVAAFAPQDGNVVTIAFAPEGAELPKPPSTGTQPTDVPGAQVTPTAPTTLPAGPPETQPDATPTTEGGTDGTTDGTTDDTTSDNTATTATTAP